MYCYSSSNFRRVDLLFSKTRVNWRHRAACNTIGRHTHRPNTTQSWFEAAGCSTSLLAWCSRLCVCFAMQRLHVGSHNKCQIRRFDDVLLLRQRNAQNCLPEALQLNLLKSVSWVWHGQTYRPRTRPRQCVWRRGRSEICFDARRTSAPVSLSAFGSLFVSDIQKEQFLAYKSCSHMYGKLE